MYRFRKLMLLFSCLMISLNMAQAEQVNPHHEELNAKQVALIRVAALAAQGDLAGLKNELVIALDAGWTINQVKESLIHLYAYAGFPRSIRALQTLMQLVEERRLAGITDQLGAEASAISSEERKYDRGKAVLQELTGQVETGSKKGYAAFAPTIEVFLKEHLFADLFERDVLTYGERELVTIAVISVLGGLDPMLKSHLTICLHLGFSESQLFACIDLLQSVSGEQKALAVAAVLKEILNK